jgi:hypothetical protein
MHEAFAGLFEISPDYFTLTGLAQDEQKVYETLEYLLEAWLVDRPQVPQHDVLQYATLRREERERQLIEAVAEALTSTQSETIDFTLPSGLVRDHPLTYFPLGFSVFNICHPIQDLERIIRALVQAVDVAHFYWLVPTYGGALLDGRGYLLSSKDLPKLAGGQLTRWESLVPQEIPPRVLDALSNPPLLGLERLEIMAGINAVLIGLEMCAEGEQLIGRYSRTGSKPERDLKARTEKRFWELRAELISSARHLEMQIRRTDAEGEQSAQDQHVVLGVLQNVQSLLRERPMGGIQLPPTEIRDKALIAAERLFCES